MSSISAIANSNAIGIAGKAMNTFAGQAIGAAPSAAPLINQATMKAVASSPLKAASRKAMFWAAGALAVGIFSLAHPLTWPIAIVAGYFGYRNYKLAKVLRAAIK